MFPLMILGIFTKAQNVPLIVEVYHRMITWSRTSWRVHAKTQLILSKSNPSWKTADVKCNRDWSGWSKPLSGSVAEEVRTTRLLCTKTTRCPSISLTNSHMYIWSSSWSSTGSLGKWPSRMDSSGRSWTEYCVLWQASNEMCDAEQHIGPSNKDAHGNHGYSVDEEMLIEPQWRRQSLQITSVKARMTA